MKIDIPVDVVYALERIKGGDRSTGLQMLSRLKAQDTPKVLVAALTMPKLRPSAIVALGYLRVLSPDEPHLQEAVAGLLDLADGLRAQNDVLDQAHGG